MMEAVPEPDKEYCIGPDTFEDWELIEATDEERGRFRDLVRRRVDGCPVAYLVGRKEFYSLDFEVDPAVLIPRPDTEWLVEECLRLAKEIGHYQDSYSDYGRLENEMWRAIRLVVDTGVHEKH